MSRVLPGFKRAPKRRTDATGLAGRKTFLSFKSVSLAFGLLAATTAISTFGSTPFDQASAQTIERRDPNAQLLLKADELIYDNDAQVVTAAGDVQLDYDGFSVVAERVSYNQRTRRVTASGNVEILEPDGNRIYADKIDLSDDFADGFVDALRVETPDNTRFAAESAERFAGNKTVFNNGVYTACEPCRQSTDKAPIWQVKAQRVILNGETRSVTYRNATFELYGQPIAYLPYFSHADPSIKRKSGFLIPRIGYESDLGWWYNQRYFWETGDSHDLTFGLTGYSRQGFLGEVKWRHQLENGFYNLRAAGISQREPSAFEFEPSRIEIERGMIATKGRFEINPRWTFGWDILAQSDENFSRVYRIDDYTSTNITNQVYLTGLNDRSYLNLAAYQFLIQPKSIIPTANAFQNQDKQTDVLPSLDYNYVTTEQAFGGEISLDVAAFGLNRGEQDLVIPLVTDPDQRIHGLAGRTNRIGANLQWKRTVTTAGGLSITPSASIYGDFVNVDRDSNTASVVEDGTTTRYMPTAALEARYPLLARTETSSHVFEPIVQLLARPSLSFDGVLPNEDSQSLVFDTTTLFQHDKFSGYDRIEGGTRLNAGLRYSGVFENGVTLTGLVGQSYHLAGRNPFAREDDLVNAGEESGLESDRSDVVASLGVGLETSLLFNLQGRFDEDNFAMRRGEASLQFTGQWLQINGNYTFIDDQPDYGFPTDRQQVGFTASARVNENWTVFGGAQYNIESGIFVSDSLGLRYQACACFSMSVAVRERRDLEGDPDRSIAFQVSLRTLGDFGGSVDEEDILNESEETGF